VQRPENKKKHEPIFFLFPTLVLLRFGWIFVDFSMHELFKVPELIRLLGEYNVMILWFLEITPHAQIAINMRADLKQDFSLNDQVSNILLTQPECAIYGSFVLRHMLAPLSLDAWKDPLDLNVMVVSGQNSASGMWGQTRYMGRRTRARGKQYRADRYWHLAQRFLQGKYQSNENKEFDDFVQDCRLQTTTPETIREKFGLLERTSLDTFLLNLEIQLETCGYQWMKDTDVGVRVFQRHVSSSALLSTIHVQILKLGESFESWIDSTCWTWLRNFFTQNRVHCRQGPSPVLNWKCDYPFDLFTECWTLALKYHRRGFPIPSTTLEKLPDSINYEDRNTTTCSFLRQLIKNKIFQPRPICKLFGSVVPVPDPSSIGIRGSNIYPDLPGAYFAYLIEFYKFHAVSK
jgi:hypothetical protein